MDVLLDFAGGHAAGVEGDDRLTEVADRSLPLGNDLRLEAAIAVAWTFDFYLAEVATYCLARGAIAGVAAAPAFRIVLWIAEVLFHFHFQEGLKGVLYERLKQLLGIHPLRAAASAHLVHQQVLEILRILRAGGNSRSQRFSDVMEPIPFFFIVFKMSSTRFQPG